MADALFRQKKTAIFQEQKGCLYDGKQNISIEIVLQKLDNPVNFTAANGVNANMSNGGAVNIPTNGLKDENGNAYSGNASMSPLQAINTSISTMNGLKLLISLVFKQ